MSNISYLKLLQNIEAFASAHLQVKKFASDFPGQMPNFATKDEAYPILFVSPTNSIFNNNTTTFEIDVYCWDIIQKDRENINEILSDTNQIISDLDKWFRDGDIYGIDLIQATTAEPLNNGLLDYAAGWQMRLVLEVNTYGVCEIPFDESPVVVTEVNDIVYSKYLTCETLENCPIIQELQQNIRPDIFITGFTYDNANTLTIFDSTGNTFSTSINIMSGLTVNGSLSATTFYGDGSNLTGLVTQDTYVTGGTYDNGTAIFTNNTGGTFSVTGFSTSVASEVVYFDTIDPSTSGTTFDPNTPATQDILYVSLVDASTWIWNGSNYVGYSATTSTTEWYLNGTNVDASGNKTAAIHRDGAVHVGRSGTTANQFSVYNTGLTLSVGVSVAGTLFSYGAKSVTTNTVLGRNALLSATTANNVAIGDRALTMSTAGENTAVGARALTSNTTGTQNVALGRYTLFNNQTGNNNVGIGVSTLFNNISGSGLIAIGTSVMTNTTGATNTIAIGTNALYESNASDNVAIGISALRSNLTGGWNISLGSSSNYYNTTGNNNVGIGYLSNLSNTTGSNNIGIGSLSNYLNTVGNYNIGIGYNTLRNNTSSFNTAVGFEAGKLTTSGANNTIVGAYGITNNTSGYNNTAIGFQSGYDMTYGVNNIFIGHNSGRGFISGNYNTIIGTVSNVPSGLTSSLILADGNNSIKLSADSSNYIYIPTLPASGNTSDNLLVRSSNGQIKYISTSLLSGSTSSGGSVTGFTYSNNLLTIKQNTGDLSVLVNTMTGLTVNGDITVTGTSALNGTITSTGLANTGTTRMVESSSGGTVTATREIISGYVSDSTVITNLTTAVNWTINGSYTGTSITGTYQGQNYYDDNYFYTAVADNLWIRLIRG